MKSRVDLGMSDFFDLIPPLLL